MWSPYLGGPVRWYDPLVARVLGAGCGAVRGDGRALARAAPCRAAGAACDNKTACSLGSECACRV